MTSDKNDDENGLHRLPGTNGQQEGGLIIKKKTLATSSDDQHIFKVPQLPPSTSSFGLDKLAAEKRRVQSSNSSSKRSKTSSFDDMDDDDNQSHKNKSRHLREQRVETPSSSRSSHHDIYDKSRPVPKHMQRGLAYGKEGHKQRMLIHFIYFLNNNYFQLQIERVMITMMMMINMLLRIFVVIEVKLYTYKELKTPFAFIRHTIAC
jgi:hypothetical protein